MHRHDSTIHQRRAARFAGVLGTIAAVTLIGVLAHAVGTARAGTRPILRIGAIHNAHLRETILVDADGHTLYRLRTETARHIVCTGACTKLWPPLLVRSRATRLLAARGVHGRLSIVRRPDGGRQVALDGRPLYTFARDRGPGDVLGQDFGHVWLVLPQSAAHGARSRRSSVHDRHVRPHHRVTPRRHVAPRHRAVAHGIPQHNGGDMDADNNGGRSDGDGNR